MKYFQHSLSFIKRFQIKKVYQLFLFRSNDSTEFENKDFEKVYDEKDIDHNFSVPRTP